MGNCLQAAETDNVDLLRSDNETVSLDGPSSGTIGNRRRSSSSSEADLSERPARSSRRRHASETGQNTGGRAERRRRRSTESDIYQRSMGEYEIENTCASGRVYHPSPGVSRQASELTEEEQIKIAQRIGLIHHLPVDIYVNGSKTDTECIICMVEFMEGDSVRYLPCMHTYHVACIDDWLMRSFSCPSCLEPVDSALLTSYDQSSPQQLDQLTAVKGPTQVGHTDQD